MEQHTPGPWLMFSNTIGVGVTPVDEYQSDICRCDNTHDTSRIKEEHEANARLIAAAPELLEALRGLLRVGEDADIGGMAIENIEIWRNAARAAIAKALGE